jgi:hypothetical protein
MPVGFSAAPKRKKILPNPIIIISDMKKLLLSWWFFVPAFSLTAQDYPNPEFSNEVYAFRRDSSRLTRLEKEYSEIINKGKMVGMGGSQTYYEIEKTASPRRFPEGAPYSFVFSTNGAGGSPFSRNSTSDSMLRANGMDPEKIANMGMDPAQMVNLYRLEPEKGVRRLIIASNGGVFNPGKKTKQVEKIPMSYKKVREGYFEMIPDKPLPKGEYAFVIHSTGMDAARGAASLYCFGVD